MDEEKNIDNLSEESPPANETAAEPGNVEVAEAIDNESAAGDLSGADNQASNDAAGDAAGEEMAGDPSLISQESIDKAMQDFSGGGEGGADMTGLSSADEPVVRHADFQQLSETADGKSVRNIELLMDVDLPVSIELGRTRMNVSDILALGPGSVVELDKLVGEPVDLLVNSKCVARGEVVVVDENFGLRITQLVSPEERIKNLQ